jgi:hypothetical protein
MPSLDDVKAQVGAEKTKVFSSIEAIIGSPYAVSALLAAAIAFASHLIWAPERMAPLFDNFSSVTLGLPPIDFGVLGQGAQDAIDAAIRQGAPDVAAETLTSNAWAVPALNAAGLIAALLLLGWNLLAMLKRKRAETAARLAAERSPG